MLKPLGVGLVSVLFIALIVVGIGASRLPAIGAGALLFPTRHANHIEMPDSCAERVFAGVDIELRGWQCRSGASNHNGTIVYLHGVADNRGSSIAAIEMFLPLGFDVVAYDSRGHGSSGGDRCTYGYFEKRDLQRVLDQIGDGRVVLIGHSLGAAVALQAAAVEPRVRAVVAASTFSDLRTVASERAFNFPAWSLGPAFARAERDGQFVVDEVSPMKSARIISVPVLLIHGQQDRDTTLNHSQRVFDALRGPKKLIVVPAASHNDVLRAAQWDQVKLWLLSSLPK